MDALRQMTRWKPHHDGDGEVPCRLSDVPYQGPKEPASDDRTKPYEVVWGPVEWLKTDETELRRKVRRESVWPNKGPQRRTRK